MTDTLGPDFRDLYWTGVSGEVSGPPNLIWHTTTDGTCGGDENGYGTGVVAPDGATAVSLCSEIPAGPNVELLAGRFTNAPPNLWSCY
jgi:hypothetical protein